MCGAACGWPMRERWRRRFAMFLGRTLGRLRTPRGPGQLWSRRIWPTPGLERREQLLDFLQARRGVAFCQARELAADHDIIVAESEHQAILFYLNCGNL